MALTDYQLTATDITKIYGALRSELNNPSVSNIRNTAAAAGIEVAEIPSKSEMRTGTGSRSEVMPAIDHLFGQLAPQDQVSALCIIAERLKSENPRFASNLQEMLGKHGFQFIDGTFVSMDILDARESRYLPLSSSSEIARATARLIDGDYSGAITTACGAVDLITQKLYLKHNWGDPGQVSFQAKVNTAFKRLLIFEKMQDEFIELGMKKDDSASLVENFSRITNHAAQALQTLRRARGDTHGEKPALRKTAYDSIIAFSKCVRRNRSPAPSWGTVATASLLALTAAHKRRGLQTSPPN